MLVATILSAQCTDERVNEVTETLFRKYRSGPGLPRRARRPSSRRTSGPPASSTRRPDFDPRRGAADRRRSTEATSPTRMEELITLPGVARKTANIVLGNSFGTVVGIAVDTHVRRVSQRLGFTSTTDPDKIEGGSDGDAARAAWFQFTYTLDRSRTRGLRRADAEVRVLSGERTLSLEPGVTQPPPTARRPNRRSGRRSPPRPPPPGGAPADLRADPPRPARPTRRRPGTCRGPTRDTRSARRTRSQTARARAVCSTAGPVVPTGKNSSGSDRCTERFDPPGLTRIPLERRPQSWPPLDVKTPVLP